MKSVGIRLREKRKELNLTILQVCKLTGLSTGNVSAWELGKFLPSSLALIELSKVLNCSIDWILLGDDAKINTISNNTDEEISNLSEDDTTVTEQLLLTLFDELAEDDQKDIVKIIKSRLKNKSNDVSSTTLNAVQKNKKNTVKPYPFLIK